MIPDPGTIAAMTETELDQLRRQVLDEADRRVVVRRDQVQQQAERQRAAGVVRDEIRAFLRAGGKPEQLHSLLDRVVEQLGGGDGG